MAADRSHIQMLPDAPSAVRFLPLCGVIAQTILLGTLWAYMRPSFFWHDDYQSALLPGLVEAARGWINGSPSVLTQTSWFAANLGGEFQYGVFALPSTIVVAVLWSLGLSAAAAATVLSLVFLSLAAAGGYCLGRSYGLRPSLAVVVAIAGSQNGWMIAWGATNWIPALLSFAWLPWFWLGCRRIRSGIGGFRTIILCGISLSFLITAGWPFTIAAAALIGAVIALPAFWKREWDRVKALCALAGLGGALSAPALFTMLDFLRQTARTEEPLQVWREWVVPPAAFVGTIFPTFSSAWIGWFRRTDHAAAEFAGAFVPVVLMVVALSRLRRHYLRAHLSEWTLLALFTLLAGLPSVGPFRYSFRWLAYWHLVLALVGCLGAEALWRSLSPPRHRPAWGMWAVGIVVLATIVSPWTNSTSVSAYSLLLLAVTAVWALVERYSERDLGAWFPALVTCVIVWSVYGFVPPEQAVGNSVWRVADLRNPQPYDRSVRYLAAYVSSDIYKGDRLLRSSVTGNPLFRPGSMPMFANLQFVNGYSAMEPLAIRDTLHMAYAGFFTSAESCWRISHFETQPGALLEHMGVGGIIMRRHMFRRGGAHPLPGWKLVARNADEMLFHRANPHYEHVVFAPETRSFRSDVAARRWIWNRTTPEMPYAVIRPAQPERQSRPCVGSILNWTETNTEVLAMVDTRRCDSESLLVFRRPYFRGYRARLDRSALPVETADAMMPAVRIPPGSRGLVRLWYRPAATTIGFVIAGGAIVLVAIYVVSGRRRRTSRIDLPTA